MTPEEMQIVRTERFLRAEKDDYMRYRLPTPPAPIAANHLIREFFDGISTPEEVAKLHGKTINNFVEWLQEFYILTSITTQTEKRFLKPMLEEARKDVQSRPQWEQDRVYGAEQVDAARLAQRFHETYERLAPQFGYETRKESAKPWVDVPENNKRLMTAVCAEILAASLKQESEPLKCSKCGFTAEEHPVRFQSTAEETRGQYRYCSRFRHSASSPLETPPQPQERKGAALLDWFIQGIRTYPSPDPMPFVDETYELRKKIIGYIEAGQNAATGKTPDALREFPAKLEIREFNSHYELGGVQSFEIYNPANGIGLAIVPLFRERAEKIAAILAAKGTS